MSRIYFEENGERLLRDIGISKAEFARRMGIHKQNVKALFKTKNLDTIYRASIILNVPFELLIGYTSEPEIHEQMTYDICHSFKGRPHDAFWRVGHFVGWNPCNGLKFISLQRLSLIC